MDEIGETSPRMQGLLLRFLETGEIQRVGSDQVQTRVDVRVIAATNRDLVDSVAAKTFREDLYYRLNVIHIRVPPLRERREDIPVLLRFFLDSSRSSIRSSRPACRQRRCRRSVEHPWPGNVRELKNVVERLVVRAQERRDRPRRSAARSAARPRRSSQPAPAPQATRPAADMLFERMVNGGESFWSLRRTRRSCRGISRATICARSSGRGWSGRRETTR